MSKRLTGWEAVTYARTHGVFWRVNWGLVETIPAPSELAADLDYLDEEQLPLYLQHFGAGLIYVDLERDDPAGGLHWRHGHDSTDASS